mmetsp:Transcript_6894/g.10843  ORF Transcript_6894/g.10843 Transcript_6894/m.10843 type:complete len:190 (-) Transcript_6894:248-817(-)
MAKSRFNVAGNWHVLLVLFVSVAPASATECPQSAQMQILRPLHGDVVSEAAPEVEFALLSDDGEGGLRGRYSLNVYLDGSSITTLSQTSGSLQLAGLADGLHTVAISFECDGQVVAAARSLFVYVLPLNGIGDDRDWRLSWAKTMDFQKQVQVLSEAFSKMALLHQEEVMELQSQIAGLQEQADTCRRT